MMSDRGEGGFLPPGEVFEDEAVSEDGSNRTASIDLKAFRTPKAVERAKRVFGKGEITDMSDMRTEDKIDADNLSPVVEIEGEEDEDALLAHAEASLDNPQPISSKEVEAIIEVVQDADIHELDLNDLEEVKEGEDLGDVIVLHDVSGREASVTKELVGLLKRGEEAGAIAKTVAELHGGDITVQKAAAEVAAHIAFVVKNDGEARRAIKIAAEYMARNPQDTSFTNEVALSGWSKKFLDRAQTGVQKLFKGESYKAQRDGVLFSLEQLGFEPADITDALEEVDESLSLGETGKARETLQDIRAQVKEEPGKKTYKVASANEALALAINMVSGLKLGTAENLTDVPEATELDKLPTVANKKQIKAAVDTDNAIRAEHRRRDTEVLQNAKDIAASTDPNAKKEGRAIAKNETVDFSEDDIETLTPTSEAEEYLDEDSLEEISLLEDTVYDSDSLPEQLDDGDTILEFDDETKNATANQSAEVSALTKLIAKASGAPKGSALAAMADLNPKVYAGQLAFINKEEPQKPGILSRFFGSQAQKQYQEIMINRAQAETFVKYWQDKAVQAQGELGVKSDVATHTRSKHEAKTSGTYASTRIERSGRRTPVREQIASTQDVSRTDSAEEDEKFVEDPDLVKAANAAFAHRRRSTYSASTGGTYASTRVEKSGVRPTREYDGLTDAELTRNDVITLVDPVKPGTNTQVRSGINPSAERRKKAA